MGVLPYVCLTPWKVKQLVDVTSKWTETYKIGGSDLHDLFKIVQPEMRPELVKTVSSLKALLI